MRIQRGLTFAIQKLNLRQDGIPKKDLDDNPPSFRILQSSHLRLYLVFTSPCFQTQPEKMILEFLNSARLRLTRRIALLNKAHCCFTIQFSGNSSFYHFAYVRARCLSAVVEFANCILIMVTTRFSDTQWNQIVEAWRIFDTDGDGLVGVQDLRTLMLSFGYDHSEKVQKFNADEIWPDFLDTRS